MLPGAADEGYHEHRRRLPQQQTDYHARSQNDDLERRLDFLCMANMAMWEIIKENTSLTEEHLIEKMQDLDIADGSMDGKIERPLRRCSKCERVLPKRIQICQYCNTYNPFANAFEGAL